MTKAAARAAQRSKERDAKFEKEAARRKLRESKTKRALRLAAQKQQEEEVRRLGRRFLSMAAVAFVDTSGNRAP